MNDIKAWDLYLVAAYGDLCKHVVLFGIHFSLINLTSCTCISIWNSSTVKDGKLKMKVADGDG